VRRVQLINVILSALADSLANRTTESKEPCTGGVTQPFRGVLAGIFKGHAVETPLYRGNSANKREVLRLRPLIRKRISGLRSG
jgi:hypothetical protein